MYRKNTDLIPEHLQPTMKRLGFTDVTASTQGYALVLKKGGEIFGFHDLAHARTFLRSESRIARQAQKEHEKLIFCEA